MGMPPIKARQIRKGVALLQPWIKSSPPWIFRGPLSQNCLSPPFLLILIFTCSDLHLGCWLASKPDTSMAWEQLATS